jgi:hypothetical protein
VSAEDEEAFTAGCVRRGMVGNGSGFDKPEIAALSLLTNVATAPPPINRQT